LGETTADLHQPFLSLSNHIQASHFIHIMDLAYDHIQEEALSPEKGSTTQNE